MFEAHLRSALEKAVQFAREYVQQQLPNEVMLLVYPNQSFDENPRREMKLYFRTSRSQTDSIMALGQSSNR